MESIDKLCNNHGMHLALTIINSLFSFLFLIIGDKNVVQGGGDYQQPYDDVGYLWHGSSLISLALIVPVLLEAVINVINNDDRHVEKTRDIQTTSEIFIFQIGLTLPVIMPFLPDTVTTHQYYPTLLNCAFRGHIAIISGVFFASKVRYDSAFCPSWLTMLFYVTSIAGNALYDTSGSLAIAATACRLVAIGVFMLAFGRRLFLCLRHQFNYARAVVAPATKDGATAETTIEKSREQGYAWYRIAYSTCILSWLCFTVGANSLWTIADHQLFLINVPSIIFQLFFLVLSLRMVRLEAVTALFSLLEAKKQYVRYISHELRTPLSAATAGLHVLEQELKQVFLLLREKVSADEEDGLQDTLGDVTLAITTRYPNCTPMLFLHCTTPTPLAAHISLSSLTLPTSHTPHQPPFSSSTIHSHTPNHQRRHTERPVDV